MSIKQMSHVWEHAITDDPSALLVLLALADWANDQGVCWPAMESIAEKCRISERTAQRIVKHMEECGILEVVRKRGRKHTNTYKLKVPTRQVFFNLIPVTDDTFIPEKVTEIEEKVTKTHVKGDTAMSPEPSEPPKPEPSKPKLAKFQTPGWVPKQDWEDYEEMRKLIRKPMTDRARELAVSHLATLQNKGHPPGEVLRQSVQNSWQGLFEIKNQGNGNGNSKAQRIQDDSLNAIQTAISRINGRAAGNSEGRVSKPERDARDGGVVLDGVLSHPPRSRATTAGSGD